MNIKVEVDGKPVKFKVEGNVIMLESNVNPFPKWEELPYICGYAGNKDGEVKIHPIKSPEQKDINVFSTRYLAEATLALARISQTYRYYVDHSANGDSGYSASIPIIGKYQLTFSSKTDLEDFIEVNKKDLNTIFGYDRF